VEDRTLTLFLTIRESFPEVKDKVSLIKPCVELMCLSTGWALRIEEFEKILTVPPGFLYQSNEALYAISVLYRIDDTITTGIIAYEFAEIVAREKNITDLGLIDRICVERGFGEQLLDALRNDILPGMVEREFIVREHLENRINHLKELLRAD
jgi:hypothetical protein